MWLELSWAWKNINKEGYILCDNIEANTSFFDFVKKLNCEHICFPTPNHDVDSRIRFGLIRK